jgi:dihydroorotase-like cyclic amidohydrolase
MSKPRIDTHVHFRDENLSYKGSTIKQGMELARKNGICACVDMPNNDPPTISLENVENRMGIAKRDGCLEGYYLNIGITKNPEQIKKAAEIATKHPRVVGLKYFTTGKKEDVLAITNEDDQYRIYETLARCKYHGVVTPHCEKESYFNKGAFNPKEPWTWNDERPPIDEEKAVKDQIDFALENDFCGYIHIPHISSHMTIRILWKHCKFPRLEISGELTPHHLIYTTDDMKGENGLDLKTNPPIRNEEIVGYLWGELKDFATVENRFDPVLFTIGSDNSPHTWQEKRNPPYASGYQSLRIPTDGISDYQKLLLEMKRRGFTEQEIDNLTYLNAKKIFPKIKE